MEAYRQMIRQARPGQIVPIVKPIDMDDPLEFFSKLSNFGRNRHCCLLESRDYLTDGRGDELTLGTARPALYLTGKDQDFRIEALTDTGRRMLRHLARNKQRFAFTKAVHFGEDTIRGRLEPPQGVVDEETRLKSVNQMDVLRAVAFAFELASRPFRVTCGLLGAISYDFVDQFEKLPPSRSDILANPDYELYFADNIFLMDHHTGQGYIVVNVMITDDDRDTIVEQAQETFSHYYRTAATNGRPAWREPPPAFRGGTDTSREEYEAMVEKARRHIIDGDVFQVVLSRTIAEPCPDEPLDVYRRLRVLNPSPYMFYLNTATTILTGASPELSLRVRGVDQRQVEIRPIAGTKPRGQIDGQIDPETDRRYEAELKLDHKELAEHMMLVDLARNDIARVTEPGSRLVTELLVVEKYESVQHLVSNVRGSLRDGLDALNAYLATMNMGTLTGAPKIEAMKIIRRLEKNKRGYYGGAVMYLTVDGQFDSCITIRSIQIRNKTAFIRAGAGIVYDSIPATEFDETEHKAASCLRAVRGIEEPSHAR